MAAWWCSLLRLQSNVSLQLQDLALAPCTLRLFSELKAGSSNRK
uniref:Uncharacterized protein n=1 Tax=Arundo donax TaxID=35708 RepID=A0A0A9ET96_ARUDO